MKITGLEIIPASKYLFIKIITDEGVHGIGEAGAWGFLDGVEGVLRRFTDYLIGQDPFRIEHHWNLICWAPIHAMWRISGKLSIAAAFTAAAPC